jgi:hypothetical protein
VTARRAIPYVVGLVAFALLVLAAMAVVESTEDASQPIGSGAAVEQADFDDFAGRFRCVTFTGPRCRHLAPTTTRPTTTTAAPTTTAPPTTETPETTETSEPAAPAVSPSPASEGVPAPDDTPETATGDLGACDQGLASAIEVISGDTSWAHTSGLIQVGQWHVDQGDPILCWTVAHEAGHLYAFRYGTQEYLGAPPAGFASGDVETWADCAAFVWTGYDRGGCGAELAASARAVL